MCLKYQYLNPIFQTLNKFKRNFNKILLDVSEISSYTEAIEMNEITYIRNTKTKGGDYMYKNLNAELARMGWTRKDLSKATNIRYQTLNEKMNGKSSFTLKEAFEIKRVMNIDMPLDQIFLT